MAERQEGERQCVLSKKEEGNKNIYGYLQRKKSNIIYKYYFLREQNKSAASNTVIFKYKSSASGSSVFGKKKNIHLQKPVCPVTLKKKWLVRG